MQSATALLRQEKGWGIPGLQAENPCFPAQALCRGGNGLGHGALPEAVTASGNPGGGSPGKKHQAPAALLRSGGRGYSL